MDPLASEDRAILFNHLTTRGSRMAVAGVPELKPKPDLPSQVATLLALKPKLDLDGAAKFLGVSPRTLAEKPWRLKHAVPTYLIGSKPVFDVDELAAWLEAHREGHGP